jgi:cardiolipin synthase A/B
MRPAAGWLTRWPARARGVRCRVLVDYLGSRRYVRPLFKRLKQAGVEAHTVLPLALIGRERLRPDLRNHRKIVVVDGQVGFTGSQNMINRTYNRGTDLVYDELVARLSGPVALQLDAAFISDWFSETGELLDVAEGTPRSEAPQQTDGVLAQALPSGSAYDTENNLELFVSLLYAAASSAVIITPYFVPEESLLLAITSAARRGVDVRLVVSGEADQFLVSRAQRSYYEELLDAGVRIFLYPPPTLLHTKTMHIDDDIVVVGTSNMDIRSFQLNLELSMVFYNRGVSSALAEIERGYLARCAEVDLATWRRRSLLSRLVQNTARLVSEVL